MKTIIFFKLVLTIVMISSVSILTTNCDTKEKNETIQNSEFDLKSAILNDTSLCYRSVDFPIEEVDEDEIAGLLFMREEEKLARDVYLKFYENYAIPVFKNISKSEQFHTNSVKSLIDKYSLEDPVTDDTPGIFVNNELQKLYSDLTESGNQNIIEALKAGALIEETDILDLENEIEKSDNQDIRFVYSNLKRASGYHLKAFVFQLKVRGIDYETVLLDINSFEQILSE